MDENPPLSPNSSDDAFDHLDDNFSFFLSPPKRARPTFDSTFMLNGYSYTKNNCSKDGLRAYYLCKRYRAKEKCRAKLTMSADGEVNVDACHTCLQSGQVENVVVGQIYDATKEIKLMIEESSIDDVAKPVAAIARRIFDEIKAKYRSK
jgi:FLYWCH zinc finger domain